MLVVFSPVRLVGVFGPSLDVKVSVWEISCPSISSQLSNVFKSVAKVLGLGLLL